MSKTIQNIERQNLNEGSLIAPTLLVVEDDPIIACDLEGNFSDLGYDVVDCCVSVKEALFQINEHEPDIVSLDLNLSDGLSLRVADRLKALEIPFIFVTSQIAWLKAQGYGKVPIVDKPFSRDTLEAALTS